MKWKSGEVSLSHTEPPSPNATRLAKQARLLGLYVALLVATAAAGCSLSNTSPCDSRLRMWGRDAAPAAGFWPPKGTESACCSGARSNCTLGESGGRVGWQDGNRLTKSGEEQNAYTLTDAFQQGMFQHVTGMKGPAPAVGSVVLHLGSRTHALTA